MSQVRKERTSGGITNVLEMLHKKTVGEKGNKRFYAVKQIRGYHGDT